MSIFRRGREGRKEGEGKEEGGNGGSIKIK